MIIHRVLINTLIFLIRKDQKINVLTFVFVYKTRANWSKSDIRYILFELAEVRRVGSYPLINISKKPEVNLQREFHNGVVTSELYKSMGTMEIERFLETLPIRSELNCRCHFVIYSFPVTSHLLKFIIK